MTDDTTDQAETATAVPPASHLDPFAVVLDLVRLVSDPVGCSARVAELQAEHFGRMVAASST